MLEFYPSKRVVTRFDAGYTMIRYGQRQSNFFLFDSMGNFTLLPYTFRIDIKVASKEGALFERARNASLGIELVDSPHTRGKDRLRRDKDLKLDVATSPTLDPEFEGSGVTAIELLYLITIDDRGAERGRSRCRYPS